MNEIAINQRSQQLLKELVEMYINEGQPVASKSLAAKAHINLSPATIRHVLSELENGGYLESPHTSAGRIPTAKGYHLFIDSLLEVKPLQAEAKKRLEQHLDPDMTQQELVSAASNILSELTQMTGIVSVPKTKQFILRQIEFLALSANRVLVILVLNEREVQNRIIYTDRVYTASELQQASNYLTEQYSGKSLELIRQAIMNELQKARAQANDLMQNSLDMADKAFDNKAQEESAYVVAGQNKLVSMSETHNINNLRDLFEAFSEKRRMLHLLDQCLSADGMKIFIGDEAGYSMMEDCALITEPYYAGGSVIGVLGVIGPKRMNYDRVIPVVNVAARLLTRVLKYDE